MGSRSRRRRQFGRLASEAVERIESSPLPKHQTIKELSDLRMRGAVKTPRPTPVHAMAKASSGHQYIGGSRARPVMLTPEERAANRRARTEKYGAMVTRTKRVTDVDGVEQVVKWRERRNTRHGEAPLKSQGADRVDHTRGNQHTIVSGLEIKNKDLHTVTVKQGDVRKLTVRQKRERVRGGL